ncbi:MAG: polysaccharide biosynthesis C-terminal domain-containing protein [Flavobacteriales bacterium]|nr:polysaccharide biosynthesis C-terminal domain-containing protein [Flavobacteriales bacterium]
MSALRKLAGQTAIYGLSSIVARFLNFLLTPLYTSKEVFAPDDYGVITYFLGWAAFLNIVLSFGMETTFFRYATRKDIDQPRAYGTAFHIVAFISLVFTAVVALLATPIANGMGYGAYASVVLMLGITLGLDAITAIPMARLRQENRPWRFVFINAMNVGVNIALSLFFLAYCMPKYNAGESNALIDAVYDSTFGVGYVFLAFLVASIVKMLLLLPQWPSISLREPALVRPMLVFAAPLVLAGLAGMVNEMGSRVLLKYLLPADTADAQLGVFGACYKLAVLITLFIQAFRFAAEPFFFSKAADPKAKETFARINNLFVAFCMSAFLVVMLFMDLFKWFIPNPAYWEGLRIVPIIMLANVFLGIYYNQSVWYKVTDRTRVAGTIALVGAVLTLVGNLALVPWLGYMGSAWATLICYASMTVISYVWGQQHWPVPYNVGRVLMYMAGAMVLWWGSEQLALEGPLNYAVRAAALLAFVGVVWKIERPAIRPLAT